MLSIILLVAILSGVFLGSFDLFLHGIITATIGYILASFYALLYYLHITSKLNDSVISTTVLASSLFFFMLGFISTPSQLESVIFLVIYPVIAVLLRPDKEAFIWIFSYYLLFFILWVLNIPMSHFTRYEIFQLSLMQIIIVLLFRHYIKVSKTNELKYKKEQIKLNTLNQELESRILERTEALNSVNNELQRLKNDLEHKYAQEVEDSSKKDQMLVQQSKMAAMGEMMDAIAHQWKQPLNAISMAADLIHSKEASDNLRQENIDELSEVIQDQINHMVTTLNEFRTFFRPTKEQKRFSLLECLESVQLLLKDELIKNRIVIDVKSSQDVYILGYENEFKHLILNLISNSKDAFNENNISNRHIIIGFVKQHEQIIFQYADNAGGIPEEIIEDIFKPNVTSKEEGKGSGIGLYMSAQIAQKHHGILHVSNSKGGARFTLTINDITP